MYLTEITLEYIQLGIVIKGVNILYSWEIEKLLQMKNYLLEVQEYLEISDIKKNPQITRVKYDAYQDSFSIETGDNYNFNFKVKKRNI